MIDGYRSFRAGVFRRYRERYEELARSGQAVKTMIITCSDCSHAPEKVFDAAPGELFVHANVAGLVPRFDADHDLHGTSASIEYAVRVLNVETIVLLGHIGCASIGAFALDQLPPDSDFVRQWFDILAHPEPVVPTAHGTGERSGVERDSIRVGLDNLMSFPWIAQRVHAGQLGLCGALLDGETLALEIIDDASSDLTVSALSRWLTVGRSAHSRRTR